MSSEAAEIFNKTIGKVEKISITRDENGSDITLTLKNGADIISIIQGNCLKFSQNEIEISNAGIATMLVKGGIEISKEIFSAEDDNSIIIPIPNSSEIFNSDQVKIYMIANSRTLSKTFPLQ
jgi:hypothetical protein